jgi:hypothetical protein
MFATVFPIAVGDTEPSIMMNGYERGRAATFDGTGVLSAKFWMAKLNDDGTRDAPLISGANMTIAQLDPLKASYTWASAFVSNQVGRYASWMVTYKGPSNTRPQTFDGPVIEVYLAGDKVAR